MHHMRRKKYTAMSLRYLKQLRDDIHALIDDLEALPVKREIDVAADHTGKPEMIHKVLEIVGDKGIGKWEQVEMVYCSEQKCSKCPHGPFRFRYRANQKTETAAVIGYGIPVFDYRALQEMKKHIRPPIAVLSSEELKQLVNAKSKKDIIDDNDEK